MSNVNDGDDNLLLAAEDANVLEPDVAEAVSTIKGAVRRYESEGESGLRRITHLVGEVDDALFSASSTSRAARKPAAEVMSEGLFLYGARSLELLARLLKEAGALDSGLRYLLNEAPEELVIAHAAAAAELARQEGNEGLSRNGAEALRVCREVAERRGFAGRLKSGEDEPARADAE
jgi:hypothetical protein